MNKTIVIGGIMAVVVIIALVIMMQPQGHSTTPKATDTETPSPSDSGGGIFNPPEGGAQMAIGFGMTRPIEYSCSGGTLTLSIVNGVGARITELKANDMICDPAEVSAGNTALCEIPNAEGCTGVSAGSHYESEVTLTYVDPTGAPKTETGTVSGPAQ